MWRQTGFDAHTDSLLSWVKISKQKSKDFGCFHTSLMSFVMFGEDDLSELSELEF